MLVHQHNKQSTPTPVAWLAVSPRGHYSFSSRRGEGPFVRLARLALLNWFRESSSVPLPTQRRKRVHKATDIAVRASWCALVWDIDAKCWCALQNNSIPIMPKILSCGSCSDRPNLCDSLGSSSGTMRKSAACRFRTGSLHDVGPFGRVSRGRWLSWAWWVKPSV